MAKVSIKEVAQKAGVSTATVSHVINETRFVSEETRQKVLSAIELLQYQPSAIARSLATNTTKTIGLVVSDVTNPFFTRLARSVEDTFIQQGYHTIFCNTDENPAREEEYLRLLLARQIDGLIITPTGVYSPRLEQMLAAEVPIVLVDRGTPGLNAPLIEVDNESGGYQATRYLLSLGHRRIGVMQGLETISTQVARANGYRRAMQEAGIAVDESLIVRADTHYLTNQIHMPPNSFDSPPVDLSNLQMTPNAFTALHRLLDMPERPTAIFITNNQMMLGALHALRERALTCPDDVSIVCFDDPDWAALFSPPLTAIRQPTYQLGKIAAMLLLQMIDKEVEHYPAPLPVELVVRESCRRL